MKTALIRLSLAVALTVPTMIACGGAQDGGFQATEEDITSSDKALKTQIAAALEGLDTDNMGSEGDPAPYKIIDYKLASGETLTDALMVKKLMPKMGLTNYESSPGERPAGSQSETVKSFWESRTGDPVRANFDSDEAFNKARDAAAKWLNVKALLEAKLTHLNAAHIGYHFKGNSSVETGEVALTIAGVTPSGRVIAIYGIVVWT